MLTNSTIMPPSVLPRKRPRAPAAVRPADATADRLHSAAIHLLRGLRRADRASGLSGPRLSALSVIVFGAPITLTALAAAEQVRVPTMSRLVRALEAASLVARAPAPDDGRSVLLRPTVRGTRLMREGRARRVATLAEALARMPKADRETLRRTLDVLERLAASLRG